MEPTITPLTDEQINKAVEWWANSLEFPRFDNGDPSPTGGMATALAMLVSAKSEPQAESLATFKRVLADKIRSESARHSYSVTLHVDYHPDHLLSEAAKAAGIDESRFSWKTTMWIERDGTVKVAHGYRAEVVQI